MQTDKLDAKFMQRALDLAVKGGWRVRPNPLVGCIIVKNGKVVGEGYHRFFGGAHAEVNALRKAGKLAQGATVYLNLEPCCHYGKTPPCTKALIKAGVKRVVVAMVDPNPLVSGKGLEELRFAGIEVESGVLAEKAKKLNHFYRQWMTSKLPYVILKMAMTLDGKIATTSGNSKWISGEAARKFVWRLRSRMDGVMVGTNTVLKDDPELTSHNLGRDPQRVILDTDLKIPLSARIFNQPGKTIVVTGLARASSSIKTLLDKGAEIVFLPVNKEGKIDLKILFRKLKKKGIKTLLIEGGGETSASALEQGVVDKIFWIIAPKILGGRQAKTPVEGKGISDLGKAIKVENWRFQKLDEDILVEGYIKK